MDARESKQLKVGDRVMWDADPKDAGTVTDHGYSGTTIQWDNGQYGSLHHHDAKRITLVSRSPMPRQPCSR